MKHHAVAGLAIAGTLAVGLVGLTSVPAAADDLTCTSTLGALSHDGDVVVPANATCVLNGTRVKGNIKIYNGATLTANGVTVDGNIQAEGHRWVVVQPLAGAPARVDGNIQLDQGGGGRLVGNAVGGDVQLFSNRGQLTVIGNTVGGNLQCKSNVPAPVGSGNKVAGDLEDQCRSLGGTTTTPSPTQSQDGDVRCTGRIGPRTVDGNVIVPRRATCVLRGTKVEGNVLVRRGATLKARGVRVDGNIQGERHRRVVVTPRDGRRSVVKGNIQVKQGGGGRLARNLVDGDIQVFSNRARFRIVRNKVDGNLQCKANRPAPRGHGNRVRGNKEGQCRRM